MALITVCIHLWLPTIASGFSMRLVDESTGLPTNATEGYVQVLVDGTWRFWEMQTFSVAKTWVTCRELGFTRPFNYFIKFNATEIIRKPIQNQAITCTGKEERLIDCQHRSWELVNKTDDFRLVWVKCEPNPEPITCDSKPIHLTLVESEYRHSGKVAIKHKEKWKILRVKYWNEELGRLVCTTLGFPGLVKNLVHSEYHNVNGYNNFGCENMKDRLVCCPTKAKELHYFPSIAQVALICEQDIRLDSLHQEAVQVYRSKTWYYACGDTWNMNNSRAVCSELGYNRRSDVEHYFTSVTEKTKVWRNTFECTGKENNVKECRTTYRPTLACKRLAHVKCKGKSIRLRGLDRPHAGRIEALHQGIWGTVNDYISWTRNNNFSLSEAKVVCRQLGYRDALKPLNIQEVPNAWRKTIWTKEIGCDGTENVRIVDSMHTNEGRLEVYYNNSWKKVCRKNWTLVEANVVCKELGYLNAVHKGLTGSLPSTNNAYLRNRIGCTGKEERFSDCVHEENDEVFCNDGPVEVKCDGKEGDVRLNQLSARSLVDSKVNFITEVQIMHQGIWGNVAGDNWTMENAQVVCRQLNKPGVKRFQLVKADISSEDTILWLKEVRCKGSEKKLLDCTRGPWLKRKDESLSSWKVALECIPSKEIKLL
ncbi:scavenger receptor cysteine-rich type 1 protein M130-like [Dendronephthya gigantea]|uniref:scavenger receptor cysteine-rich type 1 protein M130-like n=1 Tax=Dendronephthya gigantea TaxID=151771 RepID=UPI00106CBE01|nr:scavenger receptor cysteine-rich type 1 protein M130-like [Dendronephthya gigantea]